MCYVVSRKSEKCCTIGNSDFRTAERIHLHKGNEPHTVAAVLNILVSAGGCCNRCVAMAEFVEEVDNLFSSFNGETCVDPEKTLCCPRSDNSPYTGYWTKASMAVSSCPL